MARKWIIRESTEGACEVYYNRVPRTQISLSYDDAMHFVSHRILPDDKVEVIAPDGYPRDVTRDVQRYRPKKGRSGG